jgi:hypothetical protein
MALHARSLAPLMNARGFGMTPEWDLPLVHVPHQEDVIPKLGGFQPRESLP